MPRAARTIVREKGAVLRRTVVALRREREFGFGHVERLFRGPQREDHHGARRQQDEEVGRNVLVERLHEHRGAARLACDAVGVEAGDRHADEVHQVVARESEGEGEGAREDRDAQDVDLHALHDEEQQRAARPADEQRQGEVVIHEIEERVVAQCVLEPLEDGEVDDGRERGAAPQRAVAAEEGDVAEGEDEAREVHDRRAAREGDDHRQQDGRDDAQGPRGVDVVADFGGADGGVVRYFVDRDGDGRAQEAEDKRHGGRGGQTPRVVEIEQDDVCEHHAQIEHHHFVEREEPGVEHAAAGHLHHAARRDYAEQDAHRCHAEDGFHGCGFGADGRREEVHGVVGYADEEARDCENAQNDDDDCVDFAHGCVIFAVQNYAKFETDLPDIANINENLTRKVGWLR